MARSSAPFWDSTGPAAHSTRSLLDLVAENPFITAKGAARRLKVAFTTAQRAIDRLYKAGVLVQTSTSRRDRVYCARELLGILEEPARLKPE